jgi:uncharacterized membrane protein
LQVEFKAPPISQGFGGILFILGLNIYAVGFLSGMIGNKGDLKQEILGALTAGFNAKVLHPMKAGFNKTVSIITLCIVRGLDIGISTEKSSNLSGMIGSKGDLKQGILGALTAICS